MQYQLSDYISLLWMIPIAYLLGSVPTAVWIGKIFHGIDVRNHGSGNAGATNVMRVLGVKTGLPVLILDILKGWLAVYLVHVQKNIQADSESYMVIAIILGAIAVLGHIFPVFAQFKGGKGVATIAGVCLSLHPLATLSAMAIFVLVLVLWKYVSVASMMAGISFPIWVILIYNTPFFSLSVFSIIATLLLLYTHKKNIDRLLNHKESKATFLFRNKNNE